MSAILQICLEYCQLIHDVGEKGDWSSRQRAQTADEIVAKWTHGFGKEQDPLAWVDDVLAIEKVKPPTWYGRVVYNVGNIPPTNLSIE
jgi:hypothetical protein